MRATKYTLEIEAQGLSKDVFAGMLVQVADGLACEVTQGEYRFDDGDSVFWKVTSEEVEF